jgi:hypothetical protein
MLYIVVAIVKVRVCLYVLHHREVKNGEYTMTSA